MSNISTFLVIVGYMLVILGQVTGIGVALYDWGVSSQPLGTSLWNGFVVWISLIFFGITLILLGNIFGPKAERKFNGY